MFEPKKYGRDSQAGGRHTPIAALATLCRCCVVHCADKDTALACVRVKQLCTKGMAMWTYFEERALNSCGGVQSDKPETRSGRVITCTEQRHDVAGTLALLIGVASTWQATHQTVCFVWRHTIITAALRAGCVASHYVS